MVMCMIGIKGDKNGLFSFGMLFNFSYNCRVDRRPLDHFYTFKHRMAFNFFTVVVTYVYINSYYFSLSNQFQHRCIKDQRTSMCNTCFNNQIGFYIPNNFLHGNHILRILDNRPAQPGKIIRIPGRD